MAKVGLGFRDGVPNLCNKLDNNIDPQGLLQYDAQVECQQNTTLNDPQ